MCYKNRARNIPQQALWGSGGSDGGSRAPGFPGAFGSSWGSRPPGAPGALGLLGLGLLELLGSWLWGSGGLVALGSGSLALLMHLELWVSWGSLCAGGSGAFVGLLGLLEFLGFLGLWDSWELLELLELLGPCGSGAVATLTLILALLVIQAHPSFCFSRSGALGQCNKPITSILALLIIHAHQLC